MQTSHNMAHPRRRGRAARRWPALLAAAALAILPLPCLAAPAHGPVPGLEWDIPFVGLLLSIAVLPILAPHFWHKRMGLVALGWCLALLVPESIFRGPGLAASGAWHAILAEYLPFVTLLLALFTAGGGILLRDGPGGTPHGNTAILALGTVMAGLMGTTGAAMVLIHPLLRSNAHRSRQVHLVIFFILLVANAGGATTPLGDPPLYIGFLRGVPFQWPFINLFEPLLWIAVPLLIVFYFVDRYLARSDPPAPPAKPLQLVGWPNVALVGVIVLTVLAQGLLRLPEIDIFGQAIGPERLGGIVVFIIVALVSVRLTPGGVREANDFSWHPIQEVAILFAAIFITITPVGTALHAGFDGPMAPLLELTLDHHGDPEPWAYFWLTGILSAFLDNAPTYLVFFQLAEIDPDNLVGLSSTVLIAISAGAVFFGALTYIGNAPNMMVRAIAVQRGVPMPGFFAYVLIAGGLLLPWFLAMTWRFFL
jgi:Na+/H+ antiporter NhaD/arsenite permease-like protein